MPWSSSSSSSLGPRLSRTQFVANWTPRKCGPQFATFLAEANWAPIYSLLWWWYHHTHHHHDHNLDGKQNPWDTSVGRLAGQLLRQGGVLPPRQHPLSSMQANCCLSYPTLRSFLDALASLEEPLGIHSPTRSFMVSQITSSLMSHLSCHSLTDGFMIYSNHPFFPSSSSLVTR